MIDYRGIHLNSVAILYNKPGPPQPSTRLSSSNGSGVWVVTPCLGSQRALVEGRSGIVSGAIQVQTRAPGGHGRGILGYGVRLVVCPCGSRVGGFDSDLHAVARRCRSLSTRSGTCLSSRAVGLSDELQLTSVSRARSQRPGFRQRPIRYVAGDTCPVLQARRRTA